MEPVDPLEVKKSARTSGKRYKHGAESRGAYRLGGNEPDSFEASSFRCRVLVVADSAGMDVVNGTVAIQRSMADRIQTIAHGSVVARLVFADSRILEPGHFMAGLLPPLRHQSALRGQWLAPATKSVSGGSPAYVRRLAPWVAAAATAGLGFLVFLHRTA